MKKIIYLLFAVLLITGCDNISNTPTKQVEAFLNKYQTLDLEVIEDLDGVIDEHPNFSGENREKYREIIKKQYKNLVYQVKEEKVNADVATVVVEITVLDFSKVLAEASIAKENSPQIFLDSSGQYDEQKYYAYVISKMEQSNEKVKYTLEIPLSKINDKWKIGELDSDTEDKILGVYEY
ncbi:MAG: hypothetical protein E7173_03670 [Firmicutes bacterium]|nr:hypothetical protein [Bacillota bacterium]